MREHNIKHKKRKKKIPTEFIAGHQIVVNSAATVVAAAEVWALLSLQLLFRSAEEEEDEKR